MTDRVNTPDDVVVTAAGAVTAAGVGLDAAWAALSEPGAAPARTTLPSFNPAPYLSDRRMQKAISTEDALGLVAVEEAKRALGEALGVFSPTRIGIYVGAPSGSAIDNEFYAEALRAGRRAGGGIDPVAFAQASMRARPSALLVGLPNNVLCYGSLVLDARGANCNYTAGPASGLTAVLHASRKVARGGLDLAVAGGFAMPDAAVMPAIVGGHGWLRAGDDAIGVRPYGEGAPGTVLAHQATFLALETRATATARGAKASVAIRGGAANAAARGPFLGDPTGDAAHMALRGALAAASASLSEVGLLLVSGAGVAPVDVAEQAALSRVFAEGKGNPALGISSRVLGFPMEASGVLELALLPRLMACAEVPEPMRPRGELQGVAPTRIDPSKPLAALLRCGPSGDAVCLVVEREGAP
jgi:3-oxoacyl-[acyl-carrier-protein] synthase II